MIPQIRRIRKAIVPIGMDEAGDIALELAKILADEVILVGIDHISKGQSISAGAQTARQIRKRLLQKSGGTVHFKSSVIVSEKPWQDLVQVITAEKPDILITEWHEETACCGISLIEMFSNSLCDVAMVRGKKPFRYNRTLVAVRGGPYSELALQIGMGLHPHTLDVLHLSLTDAVEDAPFKGLERIIRQLPEVNLLTLITDDFVRTLFEESSQYNLVILGAVARNSMGSSPISPVVDKLIHESPANIIIIKTRRPFTEAMFNETGGAQAISILVDKWFAENTYHADEFLNLQQLLDLKEQQGITISLAMPALNEEKTVGKVITTIKEALMEKVPLLDEIVLIDSNSKDNTRRIAESLGVPVFIHQELLPEMGSRTGKGEALWKSLLVTRGDIIAWIDTDIVNIHPRFVYGIIGPLLLDSSLQFVKGFYRRPLRVGTKIQAGGGGRVTELTARPLLNLFYPELSGVIQPLAGEYAGRREALERAVFFSGYGVETGLLIDIFEKYGLQGIAQVDLLERIHHNQELEALSKMSFAIIQTVLRKLEIRYERSIIEEVNKTMKLIRHSGGEYFLEVEEIAERERPPMISLPTYLNRNKP